jgi:hypothetical protein
MSQCICKPWKGYHLPACPCQSKYEELRRDELEACDLSDAEAKAEAEKLVQEGWRQQSRKYRRVVLIPSGSSSIAELERLDPEGAAAVRRSAEEFLEREARASLRHYGETKELPLKVFEAFRKMVQEGLSDTHEVSATQATPATERVAEWMTREIERANEKWEELATLIAAKNKNKEPK